MSVPVADIAAGHYASTAILAALSRRLVTGRGDYIDLSLHDSIVPWLTYLASYYFATGKEPQRLGSAHPSIIPYQAFRCKDKDLVLAMGNDHQWTNFCHATGQKKLLPDQRFSTNPARVKNRQLLIPVLKRMFHPEKSQGMAQYPGSSPSSRRTSLQYSGRDTRFSCTLQENDCEVERRTFHIWGHRRDSTEQFRRERCLPHNSDNTQRILVRLVIRY